MDIIDVCMKKYAEQWAFSPPFVLDVMHEFTISEYVTNTH